MRAQKRLINALCLAVPFLLIFAQTARGQETSAAVSQDGDDVVKITTELVQTSVSVQDKKGKFVDGLKKEDFELKVDGKPVEVGFFERVTAGIAGGQPQTANQPAPVAAAPPAPARRIPVRGRIIAFFIDDVHISAGNLKKAKEAILKFIDKDMGQYDMVAIVSATGQPGFLQQYTDNKDVLRAALERIKYKSFETRDGEMPNISYYQAIQVDRGDRATIEFLVDQTMRQGIVPGTPGGGSMSDSRSGASGMSDAGRGYAEDHLKKRVEFMLRQGSKMVLNALSTLESLIRYSTPIPGRKLVFLISDGFFLDSRTGNMLERMRSITDASTRAGVVIYSMDAKGLVTGMDDPGLGETFDPNGLAARSGGGEISESQDALNSLAVDTGGRFIKNTNALDSSMSNILKETSVYYMLAWRPEPDPKRSGKFHKIEVEVKNHPELSVRVQRGYFDARPEEKPKKDESSAKNEKNEKKGKAKAKPQQGPLEKALLSRYPQRELPTELTLSYMDTPLGTRLVASMKIEGSSVRFAQASKPGAIIDIEGVVFDSQGKSMGGFNERLQAPPPPASVTDPRLPDVLYNYYSTLKPGLYQVRVAARYDANGQVGSAVQWVEIPDLSKQRFSMSSLIVGERKFNPAQEKKEDAPLETVPVSVDRRFERTSNLRFLVYIYNAKRPEPTAQPQVELQVQILRSDDKPLAKAPVRQLSADTQDPARLAYASEIPLQDISPGQYTLQVTATDRIAKTSTSQKVRFEIQ
jgi:VWFA-related protein